MENAQEMTGNLVYLQVLTKQIDDGLVIYSLKKSIFLSFQVFHILFACLTTSKYSFIPREI